MQAFRTIKGLAKGARSALKLAPADFVVRGLRKRGLDLSQISALEMFGCIGENQTPVFAAACRSIDIWEISPHADEILRGKFPRARIKITDSYQEIAATTYKYDLILVDNPPDLHGGHWEHFDIFPAVFRVLNDPAVLVLNVIPTVHRGRALPNAANRKVCRKIFYGGQDEERLTRQEIERAYARHAADAGWRVTDAFFNRRWVFPSEDDVLFNYTITLTRQQPPSGT